MRLSFSRYYFALLIVLVASVRTAAAGDATDLLRLGVQSIILQQQREENAARSRPPPAQVQPKAPRRQTARPVRNQQVSEVQRRLNEMGYNAGPVDGQFGRKTRAAIKAFQRDQGLAPSGKPTRQLLEQLRYAQPRPFTQPPQTGGQVNTLAAFNLLNGLLGARVTRPEGQLLRSFTREELGAAQAQLQATQAEQAECASAAPTIDIAALVHVGAELMGKDPLSVIEGIVGWRGDRNMNAFEKRDLAQRLVAESRDRSGDDSYWVGGNIVWDSYDFSSKRFPVKSLGLAVLAPLDETVPRGVTLQAINAEKFALPMPPDVARSFGRCQAACPRAGPCVAFGLAG